MVWGMSILQRYTEVPATLEAAARRYLREHDITPTTTGAVGAVRAAEAHAIGGDPWGAPRRQMTASELEAAARAAAWRRAKGRALGLFPGATSLYWPPADPRYVLYVGRSD